MTQDRALVAREPAAQPHPAAPAEPDAEAGMATVEYAIVTLAAAAFGGLLLVILSSDEVRTLLLGLVRGALTQ